MSATVGQRIADYRAKADLNIDELAERTGLEAGFLKSVEDNDIYPSLGPLIKIARVLGVRLGTFLDDHISEDPLVVRLADRRQQLTTHRGDKTAAEVAFYSLGRGKTDRHMEPFFIELLPESGKERTLSSHEGEEFVVVLSGRAELVYGDDRTILDPGDSVYYNSIVPHHLGCYGDEKARIYAVIYIPE